MVTPQSALSPEQTYAHAGPCAISSRRNIRLQGSTSAHGQTENAAASSRRFTIHLSVTRPTSGSEAARQPPYPVVVLINGFQMRASFYQAYAERLASWGFVCVQYDDPLLRIIEDATELQYFGPIVAWLREQNAKRGGFLHGVLDLSKLAVAGHSRGGKLAGLLYAAHPEVGAAFLIDPVDNTSQTPESAAYPSAVKALRAAGRTYAQLGAGVTGRCNPEGANYKAFWDAAPGGSWQAVVQRSGHMQFLSAGWALDPAFRVFCGSGGASPRQVIHLALPPLVAWLDLAFNPKASQALQVAFQRWLVQREAAEELAVTVKAEAASPQRQAGQTSRGAAAGAALVGAS